MALKVFVELDGIELTQRELETILFLHDYIRHDPLHRPPTHQELLAHLNGVLPQAERLVSTQQTQRIAESLREKGLLFNPGKHKDVVLAKQRNMLLEGTGESLVLQYRAKRSHHKATSH